MDKKILLNMLCIMFITGINDCHGDLAFRYFASNVQKFLKIVDLAPLLGKILDLPLIYKHKKLSGLRNLWNDKWQLIIKCETQGDGASLCLRETNHVKEA